jgi:DNA-binding response OmpR family regulator
MLQLRHAPAAPRRHEDTMIVILEDDGPTCDLYQLVLEYQGFRLGIFDDQDRCCDFIRAQHPDVLIFDVLGPTQNGLSVLYNLHAELGDHMPPVIIATALQHYQISDHPVMQLVPSLRMLHKPFDIYEMVAAVEACV